MNLESLYIDTKEENTFKKNSYNLEYELTQLKIDNYGKSIIQIRAMALTISGILFTFFYQNNTFAPLIVLFSILIILLYIENNHYCEQYKLNAHIIKLERDFNKINHFRFSLGKVLSSETESIFRFKLLQKSWLMLILLIFNMYAIFSFYKNDVSKLDYKLVNLNNDYKKSLIDLYKINDSLLSLSDDIKNINKEKYDLEFDIERLKKYKSTLLDKYEIQKANNSKLEIEKFNLLYEIKELEEKKK